MTSSEAQEYISSFFNFELSPASYSDPRVFKLDRARYLLELLGNPQDQLKIIHVAGSKGKGSTCALTASVLCAAGYKGRIVHLAAFEQLPGTDTRAGSSSSAFGEMKISSRI